MEFQNIVFLTDSKPAIQAIISTDYPKMKKINEIHKMIKLQNPKRSLLFFSGFQDIAE